MYFRIRRNCGLLLGLALLALAVLAPPAGAHPVSGHLPFSVIVCDFADVPADNPPLQSVRDFLLDTSPNPNSVPAYWRAVSGGRIDFAGSVVVGPFRMTTTYADWTSHRVDRAGVIRACEAAAARSYTPPPSNRVLAFVNACFADTGAVIGLGVLFDPCAQLTSFAAHEYGHAFGLVKHSFSNDTTYRNSPNAAPGEYDDEWDVMSALHVFERRTPSFTGDPSHPNLAPPGLNAPYLDLMGWIARNRIFRFGADGNSTSRIRLAALSMPSSLGFLMARVPFDPNDLSHYYVVELRVPTGVDSAVPGAAVLIHEVRGGISYLLRGPDRNPVQNLVANGVVVHVNWIDASAGTASVTISGGIAPNLAASAWGPNRCKLGYVWRAADASDYVCVPQATRTATLDENARAASRGNADGTCRQPYVWRGAFATDRVCVTTSSRARAGTDNAQAGVRVATP